MQHNFELNGVPKALVLDGWWLNAEAGVEPIRPQTGMAGGRLQDRAQRRMILLLVLLALADFLFFRESVGISIAVFVGAVFAASLLEMEQPRVRAGPVIAVILGVLPVIEHTQFVSVLFAMIGLCVGVAWSRLPSEQTLADVGFAVRRMAVLWPIGGVVAVFRWVKAPPTRADVGGVFHRFVRNWAFPLGGGALILSLLVSANPVLQRWLDMASFLYFDPAMWVARVFFWIGFALVVMPALMVSADELQQERSPRNLQSPWRFGLNAKSVTNALVLFNGLLAVQLVLDGQFFWLGGELPAGVTYAKYAHQGAYPLLVTALLAGGFALIARPFLDEGRWLKPLMIVWLALNVLLTLSSMARLGIYVEAYGLTYLRIRAGIWMVLVAVWLGLIAWQISGEKANGWLVLRSFGMGAVTLYVGCFVNFAEIIAQHNYDRARVGDWAYCQLVGTSKTAVDRVRASNKCAGAIQRAKIDGWRDWDFRTWRVARYIDTTTVAGEAADENSGR